MKEPKIIEKITDNFGIALLVGVILILSSRFLGYILNPQNLIALTFRAMIEITGFYIPIKAIFKWYRRRKEKQLLAKKK
jgi:hypothetical protein